MNRTDGRYRPGNDRWLVSYADFITLLFAFFVVMYAVAHSDRAKARELSESVRRVMEHRSGKSQPPARTPLRPGDLRPSFERLRTQLSEEIAAGQMQVAMDSRGLVISLRDQAFFASGGDTILPQAYGSLGKVAAIITGLPNALTLEGHTDSLPIHNTRFSSNWQLSAARSIAVLSFFEGRYGIPASRFAIAGYADNQPIAGNDSPEGRARNRRVDVVILKSADEVSSGVEVSTGNNSAQGR